jgi:hypothetical protein
MSRRKKVYGRRRKIRVIPVLIIVILVLAVVSLAFKLFRKETYASKVDEVMSSDVLKI